MKARHLLITMCAMPLLVAAQHIGSVDASVYDNAKNVPLSAKTSLSASAATTDDDYVPLVVDGKSWSFYSLLAHDEDSLHYCYDQLYEVWFEGDTMVDGKLYKKCYREITADIDDPTGTIDLIGLVREQNHKVYLIPQNLRGITGIKEDPNSRELLIYDFDDITRPYPDWDLTVQTATFSMKNRYNSDLPDKPVKGYVLYDKPSGTNVATIVEGIGITTLLYGDLLRPMMHQRLDGWWWFGTDTGETFYADDNYIFESLYKDPSGVTEVEVEKKGDGRYYNMLGQPVGDNPAPGIYIKDGRKVIVR